MSQLFWLFFRFAGRINRAAYLLASLFVMLVQFFLLYQFMRVPEDSAEAQLWASAFLVAAFVSVWANVALAAKRFHDFDRTGYFALISLIAGFLLVIFLSIVPGNPGPNRFGQRTNAIR